MPPERAILGWEFCGRRAREGRLFPVYWAQPMSTGRLAPAPGRPGPETAPPRQQPSPTRGPGVPPALPLCCLPLQQTGSDPSPRCTPDLIHPTPLIVYSCPFLWGNSADPIWVCEISRMSCCRGGLSAAVCHDTAVPIYHNPRSTINYLQYWSAKFKNSNCWLSWILTLQGRSVMFRAFCTLFFFIFINFELWITTVIPTSKWIRKHSDLIKYWNVTYQISSQDLFT